MAWIEISNLRTFDDLKEIGSAPEVLRKKREEDPAWRTAFDGGIPGNYLDDWYPHKQIYNDLKSGGKHPREK
jgi:hypothetical protein